MKFWRTFAKKNLQESQNPPSENDNNLKKEQIKFTYKEVVGTIKQQFSKEHDFRSRNRDIW